MNWSAVRGSLLAGLLGGLTSLAAAQDPQTRETLEEILERLDEIEEQQLETSQKVGDRAVAQAFSASELDIGGHVSSLFTHMEGERSSATGHMVTVVELFLRAKLDEEWSLFAAPGFYTLNAAFLDNPATAQTGDPGFRADTDRTENLFLARAYGQWNPDDRLNVQAGVVGSPHGAIRTDYFVPGRTIAQANLHNRIFLAQQLYPQVFNGVKALGKLEVGDRDFLEYDLYYGTQDDQGGVGSGGARLSYTFDDLGLTVAANYGRGTRTASTTPATNAPILQSPFTLAVNRTRRYEFSGVDVRWEHGDFSLKGEAYYSAERGLRDQRALSAEFTWWAIGKELGLSYRYDFYDAGSDVNVFLPTPALIDRGHSSEHVIGICYNPHEHVRLRLDLHHNNMPNSSDTVQYANVSWSLSF